MSNIFAPNARKIWEAIPMIHRTRILNNVWCGNWMKSNTIVNYFGQLKDGNLILDGECGRVVVRLIENE